MKSLLTHLAAAYISVGLFGAMVMASFLPLNALGVAYYALTWPEHIYCAKAGQKLRADAFQAAAKISGMVLRF